MSEHPPGDAQTATFPSNGRLMFKVTAPQPLPRLPTPPGTKYVAILVRLEGGGGPRALSGEFSQHLLAAHQAFSHLHARARFEQGTVVALIYHLEQRRCLAWSLWQGGSERRSWRTDGPWS